ncbi:MAG: hypothetical protein AAF802_04870 [Planctomycetota bacterium]
MNRLTLPFDVLVFELRRSFTVGRLAIWMFLTLFPVVIVATMMGIVRYNLGSDYNAQDAVKPFGMAIYFLIPEVCCLLGLLLWATPAVSTEIEGQTWIYLTSRSAGRTSVVFGKYLTAVIWTLSATLASLAVCLAIVGPTIALEIGWVLILLTFLSCVVHAALYILIGVFFYRRTMVAAVMYTLIVEYGVSFIPAIVNRLTINYRLRGLLADWMQWEEARSNAEVLFGSEPSSTHLLVMSGMTVLLIGASLYRVQRTDYAMTQEG